MLPLAFLGILLISSVSFTSAQWDLSQLSITSVTSDGSCQDVFPAALNCSLPALLTFQVSGVPVNAQPSAVPVLIFDGSDAETYADATFNSSSPSTLTATVRLGGYSLGLMGRLLSVYLWDYRTGNRSQIAQLVSFAVKPIPVLTSISGCQGSGSSTYNCVPDSDVLIFQGSGLSIFSELYSYQLSIGNTSGIIYWNSGLQVISDTQMLLPLNTSYSFVLQPSSFSGLVQALAFNLQWWSRKSGQNYNYFTNSLEISFAPLPSPLVTAITSSGTPCAQTPGASIFTACIPQQSYLVFTGHYLYSANITLSIQGRGAYMCTAPPRGTTSTTTTTYCFLPLITEDVDRLAWNVEISTASGVLLYPGLVSFTSSTLITSLTPCNSYSQQGSNAIFFLNCAPGATLTIRGTRFPSDQSLSVTLISNTNAMWAPTNVSCWSPQYVDPTTLTCLVPLIDPALSSRFYGVTSNLLVSFPASGVQSNVITRSYIVAFPNSPVLASVSGCAASNGSLVVQGCRGGDVLTIQGMNLNGSDTTITFSDLALLQWGCTILPGWSNTQLQCRLPFVSPDNSPILEDVLYTVSWLYYPPTNGPLTAANRAYAYGNPFQIAFTRQPASTTAPSSSANTTAILVGVLVPVLVITLLVLAVLLYRRLRAVKADSPISASRSAIQMGEESDSEQGKGD